MYGYVLKKKKRQSPAGGGGKRLLRAVSQSERLFIRGEFLPLGCCGFHHGKSKLSEKVRKAELARTHAHTHAHTHSHTRRVGRAPDGARDRLVTAKTRAGASDRTEPDFPPLSGGFPGVLYKLKQTQLSEIFRFSQK